MTKAHRLHVLIPLTNAWYALVYRTVAMCETIHILLHNEYEARYAPSSVELPKAECRMAVHSLYTGYLSSYTFRCNPRVVPGSYRETDPPTAPPVSLFYRDLDLTGHSGPGHRHKTTSKQSTNHDHEHKIKYNTIDKKI